MKTIVFCLLGFFSLIECFSQQEPEVIRVVTVEGFKMAMDSLQDEVIVDLRTPEELKGGKIPGAIVINFFGPDFEPAIESLDRNKVYLLYCASGGRSGETAALMKQLGFKKIYNMESGFGAWVKRKLPVSK